MNTFDVLRRPIITEKNTALQAQNKYTFEVATEANKNQIREAVEKAFKVKVTAVNVMSVRGKMRHLGRHRGMTRSWKKSIVTLREGDKIEFFEGV